MLHENGYSLWEYQEELKEFLCVFKVFNHTAPERFNQHVHRNSTEQIT